MVSSPTIKDIDEVEEGKTEEREEKREGRREGVVPL